jgi:hypothetical protein
MRSNNFIVERLIMAARLKPRHQDEIREKIQVSNLITRVQKYALGELSDEDISSNRLNAIKLLLAKTLPDLSSVEMSGLNGVPLTPPVIRIVKDSAE